MGRPGGPTRSSGCLHSAHGQQGIRCTVIRFELWRMTESSTRKPSAEAVDMAALTARRWSDGSMAASPSRSPTPAGALSTEGHERSGRSLPGPGARQSGPNLHAWPGEHNLGTTQAKQGNVAEVADVPERMAKNNNVGTCPHRPSEFYRSVCPSGATGYAGRAGGLRPAFMQAF